MRSNLKNAVSGLISSILMESVENRVIRLFSGGLRKELLGELTDKCFELLLNGMKWAFRLSPRYRKNIKGFRGAYVLRTGDDLVSASIVFDQGKMKVYEDAINDWDIKVTVKNVQAFLKFLFSRDHDILNLVLANEVEIEGNLNYIYRFGFLARDLARRLGVECS